MANSCVECGQPTQGQHKHCEPCRRKLEAKEAMVSAKHFKNESVKSPAKAYMARIGAVAAKCFSIMATVLGLAMAAWGFGPHLSVDASIFLDPNDPLTTQFIVTNDGAFAATNVEAHLLIQNLEYKYADGTPAASLADTRVSRTTKSVSRLLPKDRVVVQGMVKQQAIKFHHEFSAQSGGTAELDTTFTYAYLERTDRKCFNFVRGKDGQPHWIPVECSGA